MLILKTFTFTKTGAICDDDMEGEVEEANAIGAFSPPCSLVSLSPCCCCSCLCRCYQSSHSWHQHYCPLCFHQYHYQQPVLSSVTVSPSPFLFSLLQLSNSTTWIRSWFTTKFESFEALITRQNSYRWVYPYLRHFTEWWGNCFDALLYNNFVGVGALGKISILVAPTTNFKQKREKVVSAQLQPPLAHPPRAVALDCCCPRPAKGITTAYTYTW